jgi:hypothetical protein
MQQPSPMKWTVPCPERASLGRTVAESVAAVYSLKRQQKIANLPISLDDIRTIERSAARALREHIKTHGCLTH